MKKEIKDIQDIQDITPTQLMHEQKTFNSLKCPVDNGGCGANNKWFVAIDRIAKRIILDCGNCKYRHSLPLDIKNMTPCYIGVIDETGKKVRS